MMFPVRQPIIILKANTLTSSLVEINCRHDTVNNFFHNFFIILKANTLTSSLVEINCRHDTVNNFLGPLQKSFILVAWGNKKVYFSYLG